MGIGQIEPLQDIPQQTPPVVKMHHQLRNLAGIDAAGQHLS
jgi:hypothetical protein